VKKSAVFALSQLRNHEGVPQLITVARTNKEPEVRQQALFWLGQSGDARGIALFEELLSRR
jgi:HEAT repeat protein